MYKINTNIAKKSIKHIIVISAFATLMLALMGSIPAMKSSVFGVSDHLKSKHDGNNRGAIETNGLDCFGVAVDCPNKNTDNNNPETDTNAVTTPKPTGNPDNAACALCFTDSLNPTQLASVKGLAGLSIDASNVALCNAVKHLTAAQLHAIIVAPVVGVTDAVATTITQCLIDAGFTNLAA